MPPIWPLFRFKKGRSRVCLAHHEQSALLYYWPFVNFQSVRSLVQSPVLKKAALAGLLTVLACWPRLSLWSARPYAVWFMLMALGWAAFILWSFVFAWHTRYTDLPVFKAKLQPRVWRLATLCGIAGTLTMYCFIDPVLRPIAAEDYPASFQAWLAMTLFTLALDQLFLCFAPFAFFMRLFRDRNTATGLTVLFGLFLLYLHARLWAAPFSSLFILELFAFRAAAGFLSVYFYLRGGALLTLWWIFLLQLRHPFAW